MTASKIADSRILELLDQMEEDKKVSDELSASNEGQIGNIYIYMYVCIYVCTCIYICIYIYTVFDMIGTYIGTNIYICIYCD
jgi:hypothetical protein